MSVKNKDPKSHWRCKTVAFRVSPEEAERLDMQVKTSGMLKQDFIVKRVLNDEITIRPNIRIQRAIIDHLDGLTDELKRLEKIDPDSYVLENIRYLLELVAKLNPSE